MTGNAYAQACWLIIPLFGFICLFVSLFVCVCYFHHLFVMLAAERETTSSLLPFFMSCFRSSGGGRLGRGCMPASPRGEGARRGANYCMIFFLFCKFCNYK